MKAAKGLGLSCDVCELRLLCSGGIVPDQPIGGKPWTLGDYIAQNGGTQNRSKKVWGVAIPIGLDESKPCTSTSLDSVYLNTIFE